MSGRARNRRFRWSLRTLFVAVTLFGCAGGWLGYQLNWIRQRERFVTETEQRIHEKDASEGLWPNHEPATGIVGLLGGRRYYLVYVFVADGDHLTRDELLEIERATRLFPEAEIGTVCWVGNGVFHYREGSEMFSGPRGGGSGMF